jgi:hypothetical protein
MPRSPQCGRWTAWLGWGHLQKIGTHFSNRNTIQMSTFDFGRTLWKLLAAFHTFQHQSSTDGNRNLCTHAAALSPPSWDATHTAGKRWVKGFHRAVLHIHFHWVDTCPTLLPLNYYSFLGKKSVQELNDQPTYTYRLEVGQDHVSTCTREGHFNHCKAYWSGNTQISIHPKNVQHNNILWNKDTKTKSVSWTLEFV